MSVSAARYRGTCCDVAVPAYSAALKLLGALRFRESTATASKTKKKKLNKKKILTRSLFRGIGQGSRHSFNNFCNTWKQFEAVYFTVGPNYITRCRVRSRELGWASKRATPKLSSEIVSKALLVLTNVPRRTPDTSHPPIRLHLVEREPHFLRYFPRWFIKKRQKIIHDLLINHF